MDLREAKLILEKVNRLFETMSLDERKIDSFERDLMLSYTKQFYDCFKYETDAVAVPQPIQRKAPPKIVTEPVVVETTAAPVPKVEPVKAAPKPVVKPVKAEPIEVVELEVEPAPAKVTPPKPRIIIPPEPLPIPNNVKKASPALAPNISALFNFEDGNELSHRLGQQPISDLTKAIGINEKMLTINELFDKDANAFKETMSLLNSQQNFDNAKSELIKLAQKYDWMTGGKKKKAIIFIKLVRRRFL